MENAIEVRNLKKKYDGFALKGINITVPRGMIVGLIGENGAGKTTTIKSILNLIKVDEGTISIFGYDHIEDEKRIKDEIGVVLDDSFLSDYLTVAHVDKVLSSLYENWDSKLFFKYIESFKLPKDKMIKDFSSGMKMKLKVLAAICHHPKLLILDEPTSGLDPVARNEILDMFQEFIENEENSILVSSHITTDLEHIADYIIYISDGEVVISKTKDELLYKYGIVRCTKEEYSSVSKEDYVKCKKNRYDYELLVEDRQVFKNKYRNLDVIDKPTLEEIMLIFVKGE